MHSAPRPPRSLSVAIPSSLLSDTPHLREKTQKVGLVGRALAIFRAEEALIYLDPTRGSAKAQRRDSELLRLLLEYVATPQYLRRRLFRLREELRYAGVLPPLRTPNHPTASEVRLLKPGEFREGVVLAVRGGVAEVDIGVESPARLPLDGGARSLTPGRRVTVKVVSTLGGRVTASLAEPDEVGAYWGFRVEAANQTLGRLLRKGAFDLTVATSRRGEAVWRVEEALRSRWSHASRVLVAFGAPHAGLPEILGAEGLDVRGAFDFVINAVGIQGTETVRTEEAVLVSLAVLNYLVRADSPRPDGSS